MINCVQVLHKRCSEGDMNPLKPPRCFGVWLGLLLQAPSHRAFQGLTAARPSQTDDLATLRLERSASARTHSSCDNISTNRRLGSGSATPLTGGRRSICYG